MYGVSLQSVCNCVVHGMHVHTTALVFRLFPTSEVAEPWVGWSVASVCLSVCLHSKMKTAWAIHTKLGTDNSAWLSLGKHWPWGQKVKGQRSRSHGYLMHYQRGYARWYNCLSFLVITSLPWWVCLSVCLFVCLSVSVCPVDELCKNGWLDLDAVWWVGGVCTPRGRGGFGFFAPLVWQRFWVHFKNSNVFELCVKS